MVKYREIKIFDVGFKLFSNVDSLEELHKEGNTRQYSSGTSKAPHIRSAHWHHYWVGKERNTKILKWLNPIAVNINKGKKVLKKKRNNYCAIQQLNTNKNHSSFRWVIFFVENKNNSVKITTQIR